MNARGYFRVSRDGQTFDQQRRIVRDYCAARGWQIIGEYEEVESTRNERPERERLLKETRHAEAIVTVRMDRIGRSTKELIELSETCQARGVDLVFVGQQIDTSTPAGRFFYTVLAAVAEFERDLISARTKERLALVRVRLRAEGRNLGRPPKTIPLEFAEMALQGLSLSVMAKRLRVAKATVKKWLSRVNGQKTGQEVDI